MAKKKPMFSGSKYFFKKGTKNTLAKSIKAGKNNARKYKY